MRSDLGKGRELPGHRSRSYLLLRSNLDLLVLIGYVDGREKIYTAAFAALLRLFWIDAACIVAEDVTRTVAVRAGVFGGAVALGVASEEGEVAGEGFVQCCEGSAGKEEEQLHFLCTE
jgi:hypothetical protein